jgi:hypothetical protein
VLSAGDSLILVLPESAPFLVTVHVQARDQTHPTPHHWHHLLLVISLLQQPQLSHITTATMKKRMSDLFAGLKCTVFYKMCCCGFLNGISTAF